MLVCTAIEKKIAGPDNGKLYTEDDWNNEATIDKYPYHLSKVVQIPLASMLLCHLSHSFH